MTIAIPRLKSAPRYLFEYLLLIATMLLTVTGFWEIYFGERAAPNAYHHLHLITDFIWLSLLLYQLNLIGSQKNGAHRRVGLVVLITAPLLFATTALLSVHSAHKGVVSGKGDFLIVQNVGVTLELGLLILLAFVWRKRRMLHGSLLLSTAILFMGIALFFTFLRFFPQYMMEGQVICPVVGLLLFVKDRRNGWPFLLAGLFFSLNELIRSLLDKNQLIGPLTDLVGSMNQAVTFAGSFAVLLALLAATGILSARRVDESRMPEISHRP